MFLLSRMDMDICVNPAYKLLPPTRAANIFHIFLSAPRIELNVQSSDPITFGS